MILAILRESWLAMGANKLRTFLTMLGMVIGVGAVILMLAIGQGAQVVVKQTIATLGSNLFFVMSSFSTTSGVRSGTGSAPTLTLNDAAAMRELPTVVDVAPLQPGSAQVVYGATNWKHAGLRDHAELPLHARVVHRARIADDRDGPPDSRARGDPRPHRGQTASSGTTIPSVRRSASATHRSS